MTTAHPRIGFIGLGKMGCPMAMRIATAGFPMVVHDVRHEAAEPLLQQGATWAASPSALASQCEFICTSLPGPSEFAEVFEAETGIRAGIQPGTICIDFTTNSPQLIKRLAASLRESSATLLDAPVSGGVERAKSGKLNVMISGPSEAYHTALRLLEVLGDKIHYVGIVGHASICKVLHNCAVLSANLATMECLTAGVKAGVDARTLVEVFQTSGLGRNLDLQLAMPATLFRGNFEPRFALKTAFKDISLASELAQEVDVPMRLSSLCRAELQEAMRRGWGDKDNTVFLTLQEERAGACVRTEGQP